MVTAEQVLGVARSQIGTVEDSKGRQKYGAWYGMDGVAWCAILQQWCFAQVGASPLIPRTAYTPTFYQWFTDRGQASRTPRVGALVFYDWPDSVNRIQHVGIVEAVNADGSITTIEGNTTSGAAGNQSAGGGVWRRNRATTSVVGYGLPAYTTAPPTSPVEKDWFDMATEDDLRRIVDDVVTRKLDYLVSQIAGPWDTWGGGTGESLSLVDYARRANVETRVARADLAQARTDQTAGLTDVSKQVGELVAEVRQLRSGTGGVVSTAPATDLQITLTGTAVPKKG